MSCGHEGCTCGPDQTDEHRHAQQHEHNLPLVSETTGDAGCCGGEHHGEPSQRRTTIPTQGRNGP